MITQEYQVLITTSGIGSRLGDFTKFTNKSLVRVGDKPALSYIVEAYPENVEIVVTVGYYASHIKQFLNIAYPNRKFTFVTIDNYDGPGSSLAYSLLQAKNKITGPFIFHACDTIVTEPIPPPTYNWIGGAVKERDSDHYVSFDIKGGEIMRFRPKGDIGGDRNYIGLAGIQNYQLFFEELVAAYNHDKLNSQLSDVDSLKRMLDSATFKSFTCNWMDIGNIQSLQETREQLEGKLEVLDKDTESIYIIDNHVIKFFHDKNIACNRVRRTEYLSGLVPEIEDHSDNFYKYSFVPGKVLSSCITEDKFEQLISWAEHNLWTKVPYQGNFRQLCYDFYFEKTRRRINQFLEQSGIEDEETIINGLTVPSAHDLIGQLSVDWLCSEEPRQFHGDFILDNIITENNNFMLIDWRQDFGGELSCGDFYYDLAKLNHNLVFNHEIVNNNLFTIDINGAVTCDILRSSLLSDCQEKFFKLIEFKGLDVKKVRALSAIIWLNMAPLHHHPLNNFLYYFGRYNLNRCYES